MGFIMTEKNQWKNNMTFLLAMIGSAVGLGNIWRFPYISYTNGGGAFLVPYIIAIACVGLPFIYIEYGAGYRFKASLSKILRKINRKFEYIGWFILMVPYLILTYYTCILGWNIIYLFLSFNKGWGQDTNGFFMNSVLQASNNPMSALHMVLPVLFAIFIVWFILWFISHKDLNDGLGNVCAVLIPVLFVLMAGIVIYSLTLPGAYIGVKALFTPDWSQITNINIWLAAFGQIVFSLSLGLCIMLTYASYLPKGVDLVKNGLTVGLTNSGFEVFTAVGMFSILGFMSLSSGLPLDKVVSAGTGLAFIALPSVFDKMGFVGYIIGPLFFICLFFAGLTSALSLVEPISSALIDKFGISRKRASTYICIVGFLIAIIYSTSYGNNILTYFDQFLNQFGLLLTMIIECVIFGWIYKIDDIVDSINKYSKHKIGKTWKFIIRYFIPIVIGIMWITGNIQNFASGDSNQIIIQGLLLLVMIVVPILFTKAKPKVDDY